MLFVCCMEAVHIYLGESVMGGSTVSVIKVYYGENCLTSKSEKVDCHTSFQTYM